MVRGAIRVVLMAVALGILMMWIMMPTNTYRNHWLISIREEVNHSTYIGTQGWRFISIKENLSVYTSTTTSEFLSLSDLSPFSPLHFNLMGKLQTYMHASMDSNLQVRRS